MALHLSEYTQWDMIKQIMFFSPHNETQQQLADTLYYNPSANDYLVGLVISHLINHVNQDDLNLYKQWLWFLPSIQQCSFFKQIEIKKLKNQLDWDKEKNKVFFHDSYIKEQKPSFYKFTCHTYPIVKFKSATNADLVKVYNQLKAIKETQVKQNNMELLSIVKKDNPSTMDFYRFVVLIDYDKIDTIFQYNQQFMIKMFKKEMSKNELFDKITKNIEMFFNGSSSLPLMLNKIKLMKEHYQSWISSNNQ